MMMMMLYIIQNRFVGSRLEGKGTAVHYPFLICDYTLQRVGRHERSLLVEHFVGAWNQSLSAIQINPKKYILPEAHFSRHLHCQTREHAERTEALQKARGLKVQDTKT